MLKTSPLHRDFLGGDRYRVSVSPDYVQSVYHCHRHYEIYRMEDGAREYLVGNRRFDVSGGDFILVPAGILHQTIGTARMRTVILFNPELLYPVYTEEAQEKLLSVFDRPRVRPAEEKQTQARVLLSRLKETADAGEEADVALALGALLSFLTDCPAEEKAPSPQTGLVARITAYINENAYTVRSLDEIADAFHVSKYYLCHLFKKEKQMTVYDYLLTVRVARASYLLVHSDEKIRDIALTCGFGSEFYFAKRFRAVTGATPSAYRQTYRGK